MSQQAPVAIDASALAKAFHPRPVLRGMDLRLAWGECLALFGPNGAGKSTLIRVLATLARQDAGRVLVAGKDTLRSPAEARRALGVLTHQTMLYDHLTSAENLRFYGRMFSLPHVDERIRHVAGQLGIEPHLERRVHTLSHGIQKRVSLARALLHRPRVLLLDEPETGLDPDALDILARVLERHRGDGGAVLLTTHNVEEGLALATRVGILADGRLAYEAPRQHVTAQTFLARYAQAAGARA